MSRVSIILVISLASVGSSPLWAQAQGEGQASANSSGTPDSATKDGASTHILGVLPNYATVARGQQAPPITTKREFKIAALESFEPSVLPLVGLIAGVAQLDHRERSWGSGTTAYGKRYVTTFADYAIGNVMTTAVVPALLRQDPRYFVLGKGSVLHRAAYALSRTVVTRTRSGQPRFNFSEIVGNIAGATISNVYHPAEDRRFSATMSRWESQVVWDSLTNELTEFWPGISRRFHRS